MLDVHPPHESAHSWRDFLIHIATIVVGLLIAIGLEQSVEWFHHREQVRDAQETLQREMEANSRTLDMDEKELVSVQSDLLNDLALLRRLHQHPSAGSAGLVSQWSWEGLQDVAWTTARDTTVLTLMPYSEVERVLTCMFSRAW